MAQANPAQANAAPANPPPVDPEPKQRSLDYFEYYIREFNGHLRFVKILGWGGQGLVALFRDRNDDGTRAYYVVKCTLNDDPSLLEEEAEYMERFQDSEHMVQIVAPKRKAPQPESEEDPESSEDENAGDEDAGFVLFLEYFPRGTLHQLCKAAASRTPPAAMSNQTLWAFFDCSFQMALALLYPSTFWRDHKSGVKKRERIPGVPVQTDLSFGLPGYDEPSDYVHFDTDPSNILVGDFDETMYHVVSPVLKVCALLLSTQEQFTTEWNYIKEPRHIPPRLPDGEDPDQYDKNIKWRKVDRAAAAAAAAAAAGPLGGGGAGAGAGGPGGAVDGGGVGVPGGAIGGGVAGAGGVGVLAGGVAGGAVGALAGAVGAGALGSAIGGGGVPTAAAAAGGAGAPAGAIGGGAAGGGALVGGAGVPAGAPAGGGAGGGAGAAGAGGAGAQAGAAGGGGGGAGGGPPVPGAGPTTGPTSSGSQEGPAGTWRRTRRRSDVDPDLRALVARCMMDQPADRPGLHSMRGVIDNKLRQQYAANDPDNGRLRDDLADLYDLTAPPTAQPLRKLKRTPLGTQITNIDCLESAKWLKGRDNNIDMQDSVDNSEDEADGAGAQQQIQQPAAQPHWIRLRVPAALQQLQQPVPQQQPAEHEEVDIESDSNDDLHEDFFKGDSGLDGEITEEDSGPDATEEDADGVPM
ncbi:hypothetical protein N656DRAFT_825978 [Canariomyces notabilis]|uniref:Protein kinase domain-containing protein n=1 Tax=Canariomyces notabilis TaxID=2074819 RepID=A0AAN6TKA0_9PEZI|nr:hypothetical protein N656DRAFT_825978 [Canariomyces arenarius]